MVPRREYRLTSIVTVGALCAKRVTATWNPADKASGITLSNGNLTATDIGLGAVRATIARSSGKIYFEVHIDSVGTHTPNIGLADALYSLTTNLGTGAGGGASGNAWAWQNDSTTIWHNGTFSGSGANFTTGDVVAVAADLTAGKLWWAVNNAWILSGNPATGANPAFTGVTGTLFPAVSVSGCAVTARLAASAFSFPPPAGFSQV
jgi:hypothetical protein